ncbi:hypothetical protein BDZ91DRAFT_761557 [Kalaharituber pfeilii]|nr:hypothetical protein BDZ91DRAFT_761557 [Kalaharituber pfeilii]
MSSVEESTGLGRPLALLEAVVLLITSMTIAERQPGAAAPSPTTRTRLSSTTTRAGGVTSTTITTSAASQATDAGPSSILLPGWYWIRAVAPPNFHFSAVLKSGGTAGQLKVINGQLISSNDKPGTYLYGKVTPRAGSEMTLLLTWSTTPDPYGTFSFSGDTLQWSTPGISRPNNAAWLVCEDQHVYVNLGPYAYQTGWMCGPDNPLLQRRDAKTIAVTDL